MKAQAEKPASEPKKESGSVIKTPDKSNKHRRGGDADQKGQSQAREAIS